MTQWRQDDAYCVLLEIDSTHCGLHVTEVVTYLGQYCFKKWRDGWLHQAVNNTNFVSSLIRLIEVYWSEIAANVQTAISPAFHAGISVSKELNHRNPGTFQAQYFLWEKIIEYRRILSSVIRGIDRLFGI